MDAIDWNIKRFTTIEADDFVGRFLDGSGNDKTVSAATRNKRIEALNSFAEWLIKPMGILHENPMGDVRKAKKPVRLPTFLSQEDMDKLLAAVKAVNKPFGTNDEETYCCGEGAIVLDKLHPELVKKLAEYVAARADDPKKDLIVVGSVYTKKALVKYGKRKAVTTEELAASCL
jgi:site-specific recombinase XerD